MYVGITRTVTSIYIYNFTSNINVIHACALIKNSYNVNRTNIIMLFMYLFNNASMSLYDLLVFSNSLKMIKAYRNMSELRQILCIKIWF
jgi:hypothetical protein